MLLQIVDMMVARNLQAFHLKLFYIAQAKVYQKLYKKCTFASLNAGTFFLTACQYTKTL